MSRRSNRSRGRHHSGSHTAKPSFRPGLRPLVLAVQLALAGAAGIGYLPLAHSQEQGQRSYDIAPGSLAVALNRFAEQAGVYLTAPGELTQGKVSNGLKGKYGVRDGFAALLAGSGLDAVMQANGSYTLRPLQAAVLPEVKVVASGAFDGVTEGTGSLTTKGPVNAATGLNLSLRETPQSVSVITRERIDQQNLTSLADVAEQTTGIWFTNTGAPIGGRSWLYSRGYTVNSYQVDGVNVPWETLSESEQYGHGALDTAVYDSVTVVRGSTGLMTGAGEPSALMALTRKRPTRERQTTIETTVGSWDRYRVMADVSGPLNEAGSLRGRLVGAYDEGGSWVDRYSSKRSIFYGTLEADLAPSTQLTLSLEHGTADSKGAPWAADYGAAFYFADGVTKIPHKTSTSFAPNWAFSESDRTFLTAALQHQFNDDWRAKLSYGYGQFNSRMRRGMLSPRPPGLAPDGSPAAGRVLDLDYNYDTHIVDARVDGKYRLFDREHELVVGLNMYRTDKAAPLGYYGDPYPNYGYWNNGQLHFNKPDWGATKGSADNYPYDSQTKQNSAYLATRLRPTDRLAVILGGRLTTWETNTKDRATAHHAADLWDDRKYKNEFTPYTGVVVDLTKEVSAYASYAQIFQPQDIKGTNGSLLDPIQGNTTEAGLKSAWFGGRLNASAAIFESKRDNVGVALFDALGNPVLVRGEQAYRAADHTKGQGWELEVAGALTSLWQIQAGYTQFKNKDSAGTVLDTTQPVQQFKLYTAYKVMPKLTLGTSLRWQDDTHVAGESDPVYKIDSYFVVGANASYELTKDLSLSLIVNNLLDKEYRISNWTYSYGAPRNAMLTLRARF